MGYKKKGGPSGHHKIRGPVKNRKDGVSLHSGNAIAFSPKNVATARRPVGRADKDLKKLRGY